MISSFKLQCGKEIGKFLVLRKQRGGEKEQKEAASSPGQESVIHLFNKETFIGHLLHAWHSLSPWRARCPVWWCSLGSPLLCFFFFFFNISCIYL